MEGRKGGGGREESRKGDGLCSQKTEQSMRGVGKMGERGQKVQTSNYKINKPLRCSEQHREYSQ